MSGAILHGGAITEAARRWGGEPADWLDLSTGINPVAADLPAISARAWHRLPDSALVERARMAARSFYASGEALPLPVPGTQAFIQLLPRLAPAGRPVAILSPTYGEYGHCLQAAGFAVDAVASLDAVTEAHGLVVIANPNNPDGRVTPPEMLLALADRMAGQGGLLLVDEAFGDSRPALSVAGHAGTHPGLVVTRSFGKFFGLAGLRLGFVIATPAHLAIIAAGLGPWAVSGPALEIAAELLARDRQPIVDALAARSARLAAILADAGLAIEGRTDLFVLVRDDRAAALFEQLARAHILVRSFPYRPDWLRFGLPAGPDDEARLAGALS